MSIKTSIGLMSGTSIDGIDIALIKSDGENIISKGANGYYPYSPEIKKSLAKLIHDPKISLLEIKQIELEITKKHISAVLNFLKKHHLNKSEIDVIGFHGQTILHAPEQKITWQIGNAQMIASTTGINVVADFRTKDIIFGGQGAPLVPIYHLVLFKNYQNPLYVLNIGGVANATYIENDKSENLIAFDVCFGNAPLDDLVKEKTGDNFDKDGILASKGKIDNNLAEEFLSLNYFTKQPPKSLDRNQFQKNLFKFEGLKLQDALATLAFIIGEAVNNSLQYLPKKPVEIIICGGGRKNKEIVRNISQATKIKITNIDDLGFNGDAIEAEAFGFLAIRNLLNLPTSYPKTTGLLPEKREFQSSSTKRLSSCGGVFYHA